MISIYYRLSKCANKKPHTQKGVWFSSRGDRTRFSAEKPRRLQAATGSLLRAPFRVPYKKIKGPYTKVYDPLMVEVTGLEPAASWSQTKHSTKLSYTSLRTLSIISAIFQFGKKNFVIM